MQVDGGISGLELSAQGWTVDSCYGKPKGPRYCYGGKFPSQIIILIPNYRNPTF